MCGNFNFRFILVAINLLIFSPAVALANCDELGADDFNKLLEQPGEAAVHFQRENKNGQIEAAHPITPFNRSFFVALNIPIEGEENTVSVYGRAKNDASLDPKKLVINSQSWDAQKLTLDLVLNSPRGVSPWWPRYSILVAQCKEVTTENGEKAWELIVLGHQERRFSKSGPAVATAFLTFLFLGAVFYFYIRSFRAELNDETGGAATTSKTLNVGWLRCAVLAFTGLHNRVSLTKVQFAIFFVCVFVALAVAFSRTGALSDLSEDVLMLLGIAVSSAALARVSDRVKTRLDYDNWAWLNFDRKVLKSRKDAKPKFADLVQTNGQFDLSRFQALAFTPLVALAFVSSSLYSLDTATIPEGVLQLLGLSQVAYIAGKTVAPPTMKEFDELVSSYRKMVRTGEMVHVDADGASTLVNAKPEDFYNAAKSLKQGFNGAFDYPWRVGAQLPSEADIWTFAAVRGVKFDDVKNQLKEIEQVVSPIE